MKMKMDVPVDTYTYIQKYLQSHSSNFHTDGVWTL